MPTGYTSYIDDGIDFKSFVLICSRAFGATILMRDEPLSTPIPERFEVDDYHLKEKIKAKEEIDKFSNMSDEEMHSLLNQEWEESLSRWKKYKRKVMILRSKYELMLEKVKAWQPPSEKHTNLKTFMIEQITSSINFDCNEPEKPEKYSIDAFKMSRIKSLVWSLEYHTEQYEKEKERVKERNMWLDQLRKSLE